MDKATRTITWSAAGAAVVGAGLIAVVVATSSPAAPSGPAAFTTTGMFRLEMYGYAKDTGPECGGLGAFSDVGSSTQVRVTDQFDTTTALATGGLDAPHYVNHGCEWRFTVPNVPAGHGVYAVVIGKGTSEEVSEDAMRTPIMITDGYIH